MIVQSPSNSTVVNGSEVLLHCVARGDVNITYEWYRNDTLLSAHQVLENGSLVITEADYLHDNGFYTCRATGNHGSTLTSTPAYLQVYCELLWYHVVGVALYFFSDLEKVFVEVSGNISAVRGDIIRIPCEPPVGIPPVDVLSWLHDSKPIKEDDRIILRHRKLTISEAEVGDSGFYQCVANNGNFVRTSGQFYVRVSLSKLCYCAVEMCSMCCVMCSGSVSPSLTARPDQQEGIRCDRTASHVRVYTYWYQCLDNMDEIW